MKDRGKTLLILMSDTGGGHRSAAQAIAEATAHLYGNTIQIKIVDALAHHMPFPLNQLGRLYAPIVRHAPGLWQLLWRLTDSPRRTRRFFAALRPWVEPKLRRLFLATQPDAVVSAHPAFNHLGLWALRQTRNPTRFGRVHDSTASHGLAESEDILSYATRNPTCSGRGGLAIRRDSTASHGLAESEDILSCTTRKQTPFITVVTDLVRAHPFWLCPDVDLCLTPTEQARQDALRAGVPPEKTKVVGLPVSLRFAQRLPSKRQARIRLGLHLELPLVLLMGGSEGVGCIYEIARAIAGARLGAQMVVIAGRNEKLRRRLAAVTWEIPTRITGFVANVPEWMAAADVLVTKAGPGILSEAFIAGLPLILSNAIPGQEVPNVDYVVAQGAGIAETDPMRIATWLAQRLQPADETLSRMAIAARRLARPDAALQIAQQIVAVSPPFEDLV